jgi:hypothetical protein
MSIATSRNPSEKIAIKNQQASNNYCGHLTSLSLLVIQYQQMPSSFGFLRVMPFLLLDATSVVL